MNGASEGSQTLGMIWEYSMARLGAAWRSAAQHVDLMQKPQNARTTGEVWSETATTQVRMTRRMHSNTSHKYFFALYSPNRIL